MPISRITANSITANTITSAALANTGVTSGVYGGAGAIPIITVDSVGRLTSAANVAISGSSVKLSSRSSNTILGVNDNSYVINLSSTFTQTFTAAATLGDGWFCYLKNGGSGDITLDPNASETIDGLTSFVMYPGEVRLVQCTGTAFTSIVLDTFRKSITSTQAFVTPPGYTQLSLRMWGGGGGGGGGRGVGAPGRYAGGGGGGGGQHIATFESTAGTSTTVTIGAGGTGGAGGTSGAGVDGTSGGDTSFGTQFYAYGGYLGSRADNGQAGAGGGGGGILSAGTYYVGGNPKMPATSGSGYAFYGDSTLYYTMNFGFGGGSPAGSGGLGFTEYGGSAGGGNFSRGSNSIFGATGGGAGEPTDGSGTPGNGGVGFQGGGVGYTSAYTNGASSGANGVVLSSGSGGGGGGGAALGGIAGAGATPGGGGGGGGANFGGGAGGAGGNGGNGLCIIWGIV